MTDVPIELQIDAYHPDNQVFMKQVNHLKRMMVSQQALCRPRHVEIAKTHMRGLNNTEIAQKLGINPMTVGQVLKRREVVELLNLMRHYNTLWEGPSIEVRKRHLWEIAVDNKDEDARVSIQAIKEMNHMDGVGKDNQDTEIKIEINNQVFQPTKLDQ